MNLVPVQSSNIEAIGFDEPESALYVKFRSGALYKYQGAGVNADHHRRFMEAESKGKFFRQNLRGAEGVTCTKVDLQADPIQQAAVAAAKENQ